MDVLPTPVSPSNSTLYVTSIATLLAGDDDTRDDDDFCDDVVRDDDVLDGVDDDDADDIRDIVSARLFDDSVALVTSTC